MEAELVSLGANVALKEMITHFTKKLLAGNWTKDLEEGRTILQQLSQDGAAGRYVEKYVSKHLKMRTLHSAESDVYIDEVYTPLTLEVTSNKDRLKVKDGFTLEFSRIINIIGIAGQGKSTILRKLFLEEIKKQNKFPFFIELRRVDESGIIEYLKESLKDIGLKVDEGSVEILLQSNNIILLLDGFDEIANNNRRRMLNEINSIKSRYNCSVIVTSRPDTEVCHETNITNLKVERLGLYEITEILRKLDKNNECPELVELINNNINLQLTLVSPILVNLLYVCYPYLDVVPENVVDFYNKLFLTLYSRHDKIKNFNREKYSNISAPVANNIFDALCFNSLSKNKLEFDDSSLVENLEFSLKYNDIDNSELENIKQDIINITCLIQKDGYDRYVFLHKSVQEFHAAKFISKLRHEHKKLLYKKISDLIEKEDKFDNVIYFLREIDKNDFELLLLIEHFKKYEIDKLEGIDNDRVLAKFVDSVFENKQIGVKVNKGEDIGYQISFSSLTHNNVIVSMAVLSNKPRNEDSRLEAKLFNACRMINHTCKTDESFTGLPLSFVKEIAISSKEINSKNTEKSSRGESLSEKDRDLLTLDGTLYRLPMKETFIYLGVYDDLVEEIERHVMDFYKDVYKPIAMRSDEVSEILNLDFDL
ncbi:NACHT domain-containing protein [Vibrio alginolyticus]|uniref:NACHT domain-containing protein n=1 Tax=Vibrio alginolyticus TaxID=663 RepID=UPI003DA043FE